MAQNDHTTTHASGASGRAIVEQQKANGRAAPSSRDRDVGDSRRPQAGSHDRRGRDEQDENSKRRAGNGNGSGSSKVGAISVSDNSNKDERRKRGKDDDRRAKQRARKPASASGDSAVSPGASHGRSPRRSPRKSPKRSKGAVERKLEAAGLGFDTMDGGSNIQQNCPGLAAEAYAAAPSVDDIPTTASVDDDGVIQLQATLVNGNEDSTAQENGRIRTEMAAPNEHLRIQRKEDNNKLHEAMQQRSKEEAEAKAKKKLQRNICIVIVILVLIGVGVGVGALFVTQGGNESSASLLATTPPDTNPPTASSTTAKPTEAPIAPEVTAAPTEVPPLHEAPSDEDCTNIANADPVDGQDSAEVYEFDTTFEMTLTSSSSADTELPILQEQLQRRIMTKVVGCHPSQLSGQRGLRATKRAVERQLQANKYVVLNAQTVSMEVLKGEICKDNATDCSKVLAKMNIYLQGDEQQFVLIGRLIRVFNGDGEEDADLARSLGLPNTVASLVLDSVVEDVPTEASSPTPTGLPSASPSNPPMTEITPEPTIAPTPVPSSTATTLSPQSSPPTSMPTPEPEECTDRCNGIRACENFDLELWDLGCGSCNGEESCQNAAANIGEDSCKDGACEGIDGGGVGESSCIGNKACKDLVDVTIGDGACTCEGCCTCIRDGDTVPDGSCTATTESGGDIEYKPYQTNERVEFCCKPPGSGSQ
ncbi:MAG: hypothetical protein SGBAC_002319 [Bacillariaceae sp.]